MRTLGRRVLALDEEMAALDELLTELVTATAPELLELHGVGIDTAATLLVAAGDNAQRLRHEAAWAHLCGVAPIEASSGKTVRHRLNRGGDRQANHALWRIVITRMSSDRAHQDLRRRVASPRDAPNPRSSASSNATSPARSSSTYLANSSLLNGAVWLD